MAAYKPFNFIIWGGLAKPVYTRVRELRERYGIDDKGLFECLVAYLLRTQACPENLFEQIVAEYKITAPSDAAALPEVVREVSDLPSP